MARGSRSKENVEAILQKNTEYFPTMAQKPGKKNLLIKGHQKGRTKGLASPIICKEEYAYDLLTDERTERQTDRWEDQKEEKEFDHLTEPFHPLRLTDQHANTQ